MRISWGTIYVLLFVYRAIYSVIAQVVVSRLTPLGDTPTYQIGALNFSLETFDLLLNVPRKFSTELTLLIGGIFNLLLGGNPVLINIAFQSLGFVGIVLLLRALEPRTRVLVLLLLMLPSFTIWSSIAGKEAIVVMAIGILGAYIVRLTKDFSWPRFREFFAAGVVVVFKGQYVPALLFLFGALVVGPRVRQRTFLILLVGLLSLSSLYVARDQLDEQAFLIIPHFSSDSGFDGLAGGRSTRPPFWIEKYDVFAKSPEGMLVSFIGPTPGEALRGGFLQIASFAESALMVTILAVVVIWNLPRTSVALAVTASFALFWMLFATYPLGVMNPGTAVRYRTGYLPLVILMLVMVLSVPARDSWHRPK